MKVGNRRNLKDLGAAENLRKGKKKKRRDYYSIASEGRKYEYGLLGLFVSCTLWDFGAEELGAFLLGHSNSSTLGLSD